MKVWGVYARKSKSTDKGESIDNQIEVAKAYARVNNPMEEIEFIVYVDDGFSGKSMKRPEFARMMDDAKAGKLAGVVAYRLDRFSRNVADFASIIQRLDKWGVAFNSANEKFDTSSQMGKAMMYIAAVFAQLERETIAERVRDNMLMLSETGRWLGGRSPYGYKSERIVADKTTGTKARSRLVGDEAQLSEVERLISLYEEKGSFHAVIKYCSEHNIHINGSTKITDTFLKGILMNPTYCIADNAAYDYYSSLGAHLPDEEEFDGVHGLLPYNRHEQKADGSMVVRDVDQWILAVGEHRGIIDGSRWVRLQKRIANNRERYDNFSCTTNDYALLSGVLFCHECGGRMYTKRQNKTGRKGSADSFFYLCDNHRKYGDKVCSCGSVMGRRLDESIISYLESCSVGKEILLESLRGMKSDGRVKRNNEGALVLLERRKKELEDKQAGMFSYLGSLLGSGNSSIPEQLKVSLDAVTRDIEQVTAEIKERREQQDKKKANEQAIQAFERFLMKDLLAFKSLPVPQQRDFIKQFFTRLEWDAKTERLIPTFLNGQTMARSAVLI